MNAIFERVSERAGENTSGLVKQCPGDSCPRWMNAAGDKKLATIGCDRCDGNPPKGEAQTEADSIRFWVDKTEILIKLHRDGHQINWENEEVIMEDYFRFWRDCEAQIQAKRDFRLQQFIENFRL